MVPARILVVDDNGAIRNTVSKILSGLGCEVSSAANGEHGLSTFLLSKFDIVLSDYEMPGMDGLSLACRIKQHSPEVAVIIMTGSGKASMITGMSSAVDEVIAKPFSMENLVETVQNHIGCNRRLAAPGAAHRRDATMQAVYF